MAEHYENGCLNVMLQRAESNGYRSQTFKVYYYLLQVMTLHIQRRNGCKVILYIIIRGFMD